ncbi:hypothetical protein KFL_002810130 [Klebsormidium nitens]|uniref:Uncharacterized protein n=1 Tax=Klebsormidium nitens TaxID=105231 RepID=A0A1Y1I5S6_KLENI|nr:hypothetical protein KFL_002810130 [Klebsormidium nitens]|eukprot:GAQ86305.1 hypothetical protein KFL_002810130 [Klebsormidium nitens]
MVASFLKMERYACKAPEERCSACEFRGFGAKRKPRDIKTASSVTQADGKKFFTAPSLTAESGRVLPTKSHKQESFHTRPVSRVPVIQLKLRFETAPILLLRKVLDQSNPEHARLLEGVHQRVQEGGEASTSQPAVERKPKTVKVETKKSGNSTRTEGTEASTKETKVGRKEAKRGWSTKLELTGIETVDLTEDDGNDDECMMYTVEKKPRPNDFVSVD